MSNISSRTEAKCPRWLLSLRVRLLAAFAVTSIMTMLLGLFATEGVRQSGAAVVNVFGHALMATSYARSAAAEFASMDAAAARLSAVTDEAQRQPIEQRIRELAELVVQDLGIAEERTVTAKAREAARKAAAAVQAWERAHASNVEAPDSGWLATLADEANDEIDVLVNTVAGDAFHQKQDAEATVGSMTVRMGVSTLLATLFGVAAAFGLSRQLLGPVKAASASATSIAAGHLDTVVPQGGNDELGILLKAMGSMRDSIRATINAEKAERRNAQQRLVDTMEGSTEGVVLIGADARVAAANARAHELLPRGSPHLQPGGCWQSALSTGLDPLAATEAASPSEPVVFERGRPDGTWLRLSCSPARSGGGFVAVISDISSLKQQEQQLAIANRKIQAALTNMKQGLCMLAPDGTVMVCNDRFCTMFGLPGVPEVTGMRWPALVALVMAAERFPAELLSEIFALHAVLQEPAAVAIIRSAPSGETISVQHETLTDQCWIATYDDVTALRRAEQDLEYLARHDALTRLPNRTQFRDRLNQVVASMAETGPFALLTLDLRHFRGLNEGSGSAVGDAVLRGTAERLLDCVRDADVVARIGGDEFAIIQTSIERAENAGLLAQRVLDAMRPPFAVGGESYGVGIDIGIALGPVDESTPDRLLQCSDTALSRAKQDGGSSFRFFAPDMDKRLADRRHAEADLEQALREEQFVVHYQPLVDLATNRVSSFEALIRWNHPERGMIPPGLFIPLAEETGLIGPIGDWVLMQACQDAARWPDGIKVGVNVSPLQFGNPALVGMVRRALEISGLAPGRLELEITESVLINDGAATLLALRQLHELGIGIAIDDFGTGYSSLSTLRSFPFGKIKIDKSFIDDVAKTEESRVIVSTIVGLGRNLKMRTTAEGVETEDQLDQLRSFGCAEIQGYFFGRPAPNAEVGGTIKRIGAMLQSPAEMAA